MMNELRVRGEVILTFLRLIRKVMEHVFDVECKRGTVNWDLSLNLFNLRFEYESNVNM